MRYLLKFPLFENVKKASDFVSDPIILDKIRTIDPSPTKKYSAWLAREYNRSPWSGWDNVGGYIKTYDKLVQSGKTDRRDIWGFKSLEDLSNHLGKIEFQKESLGSLQNEYEVILDNSDCYIVYPKTHAAARKLGMSSFQKEDPLITGKADCRWCVTYKERGNWEEHYYANLETMYFIKFHHEAPPVDMICAIVKPKMARESPYHSIGKIIYPIKPEFSYVDSSDGLFVWPDGKNTPGSLMEDLVEKYGIKHLLVIRDLIERFNEKTMLKYGIDEETLDFVKTYKYIKPLYKKANKI